MASFEGVSGAGGVAAELPLCSVPLAQLGLLDSASPPSAHPHAEPRSLPCFAGGEKVFYTSLLPCHGDGDGRQMRSLERANFSMIRQGKMQTWAGGAAPRHCWR